MRGDTLRRIPRADWDRMLRLCNEWNAHYKMPKVYFEVDDPNAAPPAGSSASSGSTSSRACTRSWSTS